MEVLLRAQTDGSAICSTWLCVRVCVGSEMLQSAPYMCCVYLQTALSFTHLGRNVQYHQLAYAGVADQTVFVNFAMSCRLMSLGEVMVKKLL